MFFLDFLDSRVLVSVDKKVGFFKFFGSSVVELGQEKKSRAELLRF